MEPSIAVELNGPNPYGIVEFEDFEEFCENLKHKRDEHLQHESQRFVFLARILMDEEMDFVFENVLESCDGEYLNSLVGEILSHRRLFITAVFHNQGSSRIVKVIEKIKNTDLAFTVTQILAPLFYELMTHPIARIVVRNCFNHLGSGPNKVLYEQSICVFLKLATNEVGCISLKECIDTVAGEQRTRLLSNIAHFSKYLSNDAYGNYVVQHVLEQRNSLANYITISKLKGQFVSLSREKEGSHVIEKCLECCDFATIAVVEEILDSPDGAFTLASHPFGNYVIQKALVKTMEHGYIHLFEVLVEVLKPRTRELSQTTGGKHVINLLKDVLFVSRAKRRISRLYAKNGRFV